MNNINSRDLLNLFFRNIIIIILSAIICATGAYVYCENFTDEKYLSYGSVIVTNGGIINEEIDGKPVNNTDIAASVNLMTTVKDLLTTPGIYQQIAEKMGNKYTAGQLMNAASIGSSSEESLIVKVSFELYSKKDAMQATEAFLDLAPEYIASYIPGTSTQKSAPASNAHKTAPKTFATTVAAALFGVIACFAIVFIIFAFNATIKSDEDFSMHYDIPVLGNIPDFSATNTNSGKAASKSKARR